MREIEGCLRKIEGYFHEGNTGTFSKDFFSQGAVK